MLVQLIYRYLSANEHDIADKATSNQGSTDQDYTATNLTSNQGYTATDLTSRQAINPAKLIFNQDQTSNMFTSDQDISTELTSASTSKKKLSKVNIKMK